MPRKREKEPAPGFRRIGNRRLMAAVYTILRLSVLGVMIAQIFNRNFENVLLCVLTLLLFMLPSMFERRLRIDLPDTLEIVILLCIYAAEILGEIREFYIAFPYWDTMLHTLNGFLCAAIGFALVDILNRTERVVMRLSPFFMAVVAFCFSMTVGVLWEFFEFSMDMLFHLDMQKDTVLQAISSVALDPAGGNRPVLIEGIRDTLLVLADGSTVSLGLGGYLDIGIVDTMQDLFVNFIGAVVFSTIGYFFVKTRGRGRFARRFIPVTEEVLEAAGEALRPEQPAAGKTEEAQKKPDGDA